MEEEKKLTDKEMNGQVNISEVIKSTLKHWPWILVSLVVCVSFAVFKVLRSQPIYSRDATIVIKDEQGSGTAGMDLSGLSDLGFLKSNTNLFDEVNRLKSRDLINTVVEKLKLYVQYWKPGLFHDKILYGSEIPVEVEFAPGLAEESLKLRIKADSPDTFTLSKLKIGKKGKEKSVRQGTHRFGQPISTPDGTIVVNKTPSFEFGKKDKDGKVEDIEVIVTKDSQYSAAESLESSVNISFKRNEGNTVGISVTNESPKLAEDIINTIIDVYNERWIENRNQMAISTNKFIDERLKVIESELGNVENDISEYQSKHLISNVEKATEIYLADNKESDVLLLQLNNQLQVTRFMRDFVASNKNRSQVIPANAGIENRGIEEQIKTYNDKAIVRKQMIENSSDRHPIVMDLDAQLADMRANIIKSLDTQAEALTTQIRSMQSNISRNSSQLAETPVQAKYLLGVERQQKVKESLYLYLLQKREENQLSQAFTAYNTEIISRPYGKPKAVSPHLFRSMAVAIFFGFFIPFIIEYIYLVTNNKIFTRKDLEKMRAPFLGEIPKYQFSKDDKEHTELAVKQGDRDVVNESFRLLRSNIRFVSGEEGNCEVIMFTSFIPGSGKTFIAMNLGATFALRGKRVLVMDCDLRRATASTYVGSPASGVADYLAGRVNNIDDAIVTGRQMNNLDVLPVGSIPPNPTELLESVRFTNLVKAMRERYDYILIDCPPIEMMADAQVINESSDRTIFAIRSGALDRNMVDELNEIFEENKFKNLGVVLNAVNLHSTGYGSYGSKSYSYGYGNA